jgi:hypothetical protein
MWNLQNPVRTAMTDDLSVTSPVNVSFPTIPRKVDTSGAPPPIDTHVELATILQPALDINPGEVTITEAYSGPGETT